MNTELVAAINAARHAGELLRQHLGQISQVRHKSRMEIVTEIDIQAETLISGLLEDAFPDYGFIGEEGSGGRSESQANWIVDPIDGTTNYARSYPLFAISIALEKCGETVLGVVYNPLLDELFIGEKEKGATLNGIRMQVSTVQDISQALVASGFPYDAWNNSVDNLDRWGKLAKRAFSMRSDGAASLDLCHVAAGRLDAFWEIDLEIWDMAAGALIVQEAGGTVTSVSGQEFKPHLRNILASNGRLHQKMITALRSD